MYRHDSQGLTSAWMGSSTGIGFGVGALLGLTAYIFGVITDRKLKATAQLREQFGDAPSDEQMMQLQVSEQQQAAYLNICAVTLTLSLWIMAVSRYLVF